MIRSLFPIAVCLSLFACGDDTSDGGAGGAGGAEGGSGGSGAGGSATGGGDSGGSDAGGSGTGGGTGGTGGAADNPLGTVCGDGLAECPAPTDCVVQPLIGGSTTDGYCSPACTEPVDCTEGYEGPGETTCYGGTCVFSCAGEGDCPEGLSCLPTGGPTMACGVVE